MIDFTTDEDEPNSPTNQPSKSSGTPQRRPVPTSTPNVAEGTRSNAFPKATTNNPPQPPAKISNEVTDARGNPIAQATIRGPPQLPMSVPPVPPRQVQIAESHHGQSDGSHSTRSRSQANQESDQDQNVFTPPSMSSGLSGSPPARPEPPAKKSTSSFRKIFK